MKRKNLWRKISYITFSGVMAVTVPATSIGCGVVYAQDVGTEAISEKIQETQTAVAETPVTEPVQTEPPATEPPAETPPATEAPSTEPPVTAPQTEAPSAGQQTGSSTEPQTGVSTESQTGSSTESQTGASTESQTGSSTESQTGASTEPQTGSSTEPQTGVETEPQTGSSTEPQTGVTEEPQTGETSSEVLPPDMQTETDTGAGTESTETETETAQTGDELIVSDSDNIVAEAIPKKMVAPEDHSLNNANWKINVIASNAAYLGQLANIYGISFSDDFSGACTRVEQEFAAMLADPENFRATNWKDVLAVFLYEAKQRTGSGNISAASEPLLLEIFTEMNLPEREPEEPVEAPEITEVFVDEYSIEEDLEQIDRQEELLLSTNNSFGSMGALADEYITGMANAQREAKREEQKLQMDESRYDKWLRKKQRQERQESPKEEPVTTADLVSMSIGDYVEKHGLGEKAYEEMAGYTSAECLQLMAIASAEPQIVRASVGNEVSEERVRIVTAAYRLVGKVGYFWGGKSFAIGWDNRWGTPAKVTAKGSTSTGMIRKYGLDCSGFTLYCYYNGLNGSDAGIGGHTTTQWNASVMVDQVNAQPGDLVFYGGPERGDINHVGLVVGKSTDGGLIVAHCSSSCNGVIVGEAWSSGFRYVRTVNALP